MITLNIQFPDHGVEFEVGPALPDLNPFYRAASIAIIQPMATAINMGRVSEDKARDLLAKAIAEGCIFQSTPEMDSHQRYDWLVSHPDEADRLRSLLEHRPNFEDGQNHDDIGTAHPSSDEARETPREGSGIPESRGFLINRPVGDSSDPG